MTGKKIAITSLLLLLLAAIVAGIIFVLKYIEAENIEQARYERDETELVVANTTGAKLLLFRAGENIGDAASIPEFDGERIWLSKGNYFLRAEFADMAALYPLPIQGYRSGTEKDDSFSLTIRPIPEEQPSFLPSGSKFVYIPSGYFLFGDHLNPQEPHYVWTQGYFIAQFEVTNAEFREFLDAPGGYVDDANWTTQGKEWKTQFPSQSSSKLTSSDTDFARFGQPDMPVTQVNWFESAAFCRWMTRRFGGSRWIYSLPTEAEWEKAARGPDNFDYPLGQHLSDPEVALYNWKKNPSAEIAVMGISDSRKKFQPNRYGVYHLGGNVVEWTLGLRRHFNQANPYVDDDRNRDDLEGERVDRGGSWYSAGNALLYIPYRDAFQPEVSHHDLGFRVVARPIP